MAIDRRKSGKYRVRVFLDHDVVASRTFDRKADAQSWEKEQYRVLALGGVVSPELSLLSVSELISRFREARHSRVAPHTWRTDSDNLKHVPVSWLRRPASTITGSDVHDCLADLLRRGLARSTVARTRVTLSALFEFAVSQHVAPSNPVRGVRMPVVVGLPPRPKADTWTPEEMRCTIAAQHEVNPSMAEVTEFLALTGLRWSELRALRVEDLVEVPLPALHVWRAQSDGYAEKSLKSHSGEIRSRTIPLRPRAAEIVAPRVAGLPAGAYLFRTKTGRQLRGNLFRRQVAWNRTTCRGLTIHALRHFAISYWLMRGMDIKTVAEWSGHKNPTVLLTIYAHVLGADANRAALALLDSPAVPSLSWGALPENGRQVPGSRKAPAKPGPDLGFSCGDEGI
ncbi:MAG: tyrosine-type recombinase/integrase [Microbacteriaceae bacterium]|nr:tyrosine-type recombinase/integrase [Microbacteriaceae bacterium]MCL2794978.1 tyrosine-type recombinase/integrase [Microbacteriaceae bacterium]